MLELKELLRRFHIVIYTGNRLNDLTLMEGELDDLFEGKLIEKEEYFRMKAIVKRELQSLT